jgi:hypothetical protein
VSRVDDGTHVCAPSPLSLSLSLVTTYGHGIVVDGHFRQIILYTGRALQSAIQLHECFGQPASMCGVYGGTNVYITKRKYVGGNTAACIVEYFQERLLCLARHSYRRRNSCRDVSDTMLIR